MSAKTRLSALERKAGTPDKVAALHHHVEVMDEAGAVVRSFCGREAWHGRRCTGTPGVVLRLPDNGRGDANVF